MNGGIVIQERPCPRCSIRRAVLIGTGKIAFSFNCRLECASNASTARQNQRARDVEPATPCPFGPGELARLSMYRAAVRAGLYTEWTEREIAPAAEHGSIEPLVALANAPDARQPMFGK